MTFGGVRRLFSTPPTAFETNTLWDETSQPLSFWDEDVPAHPDPQ
jgi:hypothetical protein